MNKNKHYAIHKRNDRYYHIRTLSPSVVPADVTVSKLEAIVMFTQKLFLCQTRIL